MNDIPKPRRIEHYKNAYPPGFHRAYKKPRFLLLIYRLKVVCFGVL